MSQQAGGQGRRLPGQDGQQAGGQSRRLPGQMSQQAGGQTGEGLDRVAAVAWVL